MKKIFYINILLIIIGCDTFFTPSFSALDFSFSDGWTNTVSIYLCSNGKAYYTKDGISYSSTKIRLDSIKMLSNLIDSVKHIQNTEFEEQGHDMSSYQIIINNNTKKEKKYFVYGHETQPPILDKTAKFMLDIIKHHKGVSIDTIINMQSRKRIEPPPPPPLN